MRASPSSFIKFTIAVSSVLLFSKINNFLGINAQKSADDQPLLFCQPNKMFVSITKSYLRRHNIEIKSAQQLHFRGHKGCFAQEENDAYILSLFNPFQACGTLLEHTSEDYIYTNEVVLDKRDGQGATKLLEMRCVYEDKYIVSSGPITPTKNTLTFTTEFGEFETKMTLYGNDRFDNNAKLGDRPSVQLGERVYVGVTMFIPLSQEYNNDFTITLKSCFANHDPNHTNMDTYHYLIAGMCASPDDDTVQIYQNGLDGTTEAKFSFEMFKFRKGFDYFYLHCEVKLCNSTVEICNGNANGDQCNGITLNDQEEGSNRSKRDIYDRYYFPSDNELAHSAYRNRNKRASDEDVSAANSMPDPVDDSLAYLSRGPLVFNETDGLENVASKSSIQISSAFDDGRIEQSFLRLWVFSGVAAVIGVIGIILTGVTIFKRRQERLKLQNSGTVITAPALGKQGLTGQWRQGPLPPTPDSVKDDEDDD